FYKIYADGGIQRLSGNAVSEIIETRDSKLWIATEDGGINIFDPVNGTFEYIKHVPGNPYSLSSNNVHALEEDMEGNIWIGTFIGGLNKYNRITKKIEAINLTHPDPNMSYGVYSKCVFSIFIDSKKRIWAGAIGGLYMKDSNENSFFLYWPEVFQDKFVYHIEEDHQGNIWICTYNNGIFKLDPELKLSNYRTSQNTNIFSDRIVFFFRDSHNKIWFGTVEGGLIKYTPSLNQFKSYTDRDGLPNNTVYA
ncbi:unnamed protein product, partial [marine sediment metagenome]